MMDELPILKGKLNFLRENLEGDDLSKAILTIKDLVEVLLPDRVRKGDRPIYTWYSEGVTLDVELVPRRNRYNYSIILKGQVYHSGVLHSSRELINKILEFKNLGNSSLIIQEEDSKISYPKQKELPRR
jgi:hypothetical protein